KIFWTGISQTPWHTAALAGPEQWHVAAPAAIALTHYSFPTTACARQLYRSAIGSDGAVLGHSLQQLILRERLGQIVLRTHHAPPCLVKQPIRGREHDHRRGGETGVALDDGAGLVAIQTRHQDVTKNNIWIMVIDLGQRIEPILGQN